MFAHRERVTSHLLERLWGSEFRDICPGKRGDSDSAQNRALLEFDTPKIVALDERVVCDFLGRVWNFYENRILKRLPVQANHLGSPRKVYGYRISVEQRRLFRAKLWTGPSDAFDTLRSERELLQRSKLFVKLSVFQASDLLERALSHPDRGRRESDVLHRGRRADDLVARPRHEQFGDER